MCVFFWLKKDVCAKSILTFQCFVGDEVDAEGGNFITPTVMPTSATSAKGLSDSRREESNRPRKKNKPTAMRRPRCQSIAQSRA